MLNLKNISFSYSNEKIFENFNYSINENLVNCIIGPSGCGKTTLLNILSGNLNYSGEIESLPQNISYVFQEHRLIMEKTVFKNIEFVLKDLFDKNQRKDIIEKYLNLVDLYEYKNSYPHMLSGGMLQKVSLIRAFAYPSNIILLDEPFKALDIVTKKNIIDIFIKLQKDNCKTAVFVTHNIEETLLLADKITVFSNKPVKILYETFIERIKENRNLYDKDISNIRENIYKAFFAV